jgi:hypothetical protein
MSNVRSFHAAIAAPMHMTPTELSTLRDGEMPAHTRREGAGADGEGGRAGGVSAGPVGDGAPTPAGKLALRRSACKHPKHNLLTQQVVLLHHHKHDRDAPQRREHGHVDAAQRHERDHDVRDEAAVVGTVDKAR